MRKKIELFTWTFNDEDMLPFYLDYYAPLVDRMTVIDDGSTDKTLDILKKYGHCFDITVIKTGKTWWDWDTGHLLRKNIWKGSKYDLIILADVDEIFYKVGLRDFLDNTNFDIYQLEGWQMVSKEFPKYGTDDLLDIKLGSKWNLYDKFSIFKPSANIKMLNNHEIGKTNDSISRKEIKLLHYKFLGVDVLTKRAEGIKARVPVDSYCKGIKGNILKVYPGFVRTRVEYEREIEEMLKKATQAI